MNGKAKTFHDSLYSAKDKAVNGKARTNIVGSKSNDVEREFYYRLANNRLKLTALAASAASFLCRAANNRAAA